MRPRQFRLWLFLALAAGMGSCEINPQPGLPGSEDHTPGAPVVSKGGSTMSGEGPGSQAGSSSGGGVVVEPSGGGRSGSGPVLGLGGASDSAGGGEAAIPGDAGAGGATEPGDLGGASGQP